MVANYCHPSRPDYLKSALVVTRGNSAKLGLSASSTRINSNCLKFWQWLETSRVLDLIAATSEETFTAFKKWLEINSHFLEMLSIHNSCPPPNRLHLSFRREPCSHRSENDQSGTLAFILKGIFASGPSHPFLTYSNIMPVYNLPSDSGKIYVVRISKLQERFLNPTLFSPWRPHIQRRQTTKLRKVKKYWQSSAPKMIFSMLSPRYDFSCQMVGVRHPLCEGRSRKWARNAMMCLKRL